MLVSTTIAKQEHPGGAARTSMSTWKCPRPTQSSQITGNAAMQLQLQGTPYDRRTTHDTSLLCVRHSPTTHCAPCDPEMQHARHQRMPCHRDLANIADWLCGHSETTPSAVGLRASAAARASAGLKWPQPSSRNGNGIRITRVKAGRKRGADAVTIHTRVLYSSGTGGFMPAWRTPPNPCGPSLTH